MSSQLVECIANFSEGRNLETVSKIVDAIKSVPDVVLLDQSSDSDHNRSVITFAGPVKEVEEAAFQAIKTAAHFIDMDAHSGEHPRLGATDVCPFVPIEGVSMADCVAIAKRLGQRVGDELQIPVYLYEEAARTPERQNLANIRRGEYELLKEEIGSNPDRKPDFGPEKLGKAGATVIGAREALVAYNIYLNNEDVATAKAIGKAVRYSSGGLRYVKALGMMVDGKAQVSMNLTNFNKTPVYRVQEMIRREAQRYGAEIRSGEVIGLIPQKALNDAAAWYLQLEGFDSSQILENKIRSSAEQAAANGYDPGFIEDLSSSEPAPGGGAASAYTASIAAGLTAMVCRLTIGRKKYQDVETEMQSVLASAEKSRTILWAKVTEDVEAFKKVMEAYRLPKGTDAEQQKRSEAIQAAMLKAAEVPFSVMEESLLSLKGARTAARLGNLNAITDAGTAASLAHAALQGACLNVRINLQSLADSERKSQLAETVESMQAEAQRLVEEVKQILAERASL